MRHLLISVTLFVVTYSVQSYEIELEKNCNETIDSNVKNLTFPGGEIGQLTNITWGIKEFGNKLNCVSKLADSYERNGHRWKTYFISGPPEAA